MDNQPNIQETTAVLRAVLGKRVVTFHPVFAQALRSVPAAVILSQAYFWQENANFRDLVEFDGRPFFTKTAAEWYEATGVTQEQQVTARELLRGTGFWVEKKAGLPAKLYYHVDLNTLVSVIYRYLNTATPETADGRSQRAQNQRNEEGRFVSVNAGNKFPEITDDCFGNLPKQGSVIYRNIGSVNYRNNIIAVESLESSLESVESEKGARAPKKTEASKKGALRSRSVGQNASPSSAAPPSQIPFASSSWANISSADWADSLLPLCDDLPDNLDCAYYLGRCRSWSAEKGGTSADWLATAARFAHDDARKNKLVTIKTFDSHDTNASNSNTGSSYGGIDIARALARAQRICRRNGDIP